MNAYKFRTCFASLFMAAGLALGVNQSSAGSVSVLLPPSLANPLSVNNSGAQAALEAASTTLALSGFVGTQLVSPNARDAGELAVFTRDVSFGSPVACNVSISDNWVIFSFVENGTPSYSATVQLSTRLANALRARFGPGTVLVQVP